MDVERPPDESTCGGPTFNNVPGGLEGVNEGVQQTGSSFPANASRALRPIIQFSANIELYKSGKYFKSTVAYGLRDDIND